MAGKKIAVIGAGFGGMSAAAYLAKAGYDVEVFEKNSMPGGRAQVLSRKGFTFDMGPSWYMMPDVFEEFFADFGHKTQDYFKLVRLDPAYKVIANERTFDVPSYPEVNKLVSQLDPQRTQAFESFYRQTEQDYSTIRQHVLNKPMNKNRELANPHILKFLLSKDMYRSYHRRIAGITKNHDLQHTLEFMSVFMGGSPKDIPAIYALLTYVDMGLGVYYPHGGYGVLARAFEAVAREHGVKFHYRAAVERINSKQSRATTIQVAGRKLQFDAVVANADYQFVETQLLDKTARSYPKEYWQKANVSPSALLLFFGVNKKLKNLQHHNLFFDTDWDGHFKKLADGKITKAPLFYMSVPSKSDNSVAPKGNENLFVLAPMPAGTVLKKRDVTAIKTNIIKRIEQQSKTTLANNITVEEVRTEQYFKETFNAYKGNAFGLSHTLRQSAVFRPKMQSKKLENLFFVGQYTNPGTGVPMVVLSGKVVAELVRSAK